MFEAYYDSRTLLGMLIPASEIHPFPKYGEEVVVPEERRAKMIAEGEAVLGKEWPILRATDYMRYCVDGDRAIYETKNFARRDGLSTVMMAEYVEQTGRFLPDIVDLLWATLEESTWNLPAMNATVEPHWSKWGKVYLDIEKVPLHDPEHPIRLDLFSGATAGQLAVLYYLFKTQLDEITPLLARRIEMEVEKRLIDRFLDGYYWWSGLEQKTNNWNPWIISNVLTVTALVLKDEEKRARVVARACLLLDQFVRDYHADGGCDEGPSYWSAAGSALGTCIGILSDLTGGKMDGLFREPLIRDIMAYIYRVNLCGDFYVNFADCASQVIYGGGRIYLLGKATGDETMMQFGAALNKRRKAEKDQPLRSMRSMYYGAMQELLVQSELDAVEGECPYLESMYLDGIQLMVERQAQGDNHSMILAAKAGHNGENHNHNDVGTFLLYANEAPVLCDIGPGTYTAQTFNEHRYELRQMQSLYHNVPILNGVAQKNGAEFTAKNVSYSKENGNTVFTQDLSGAYPAECGAECWNRTFCYDRANRQIVLEDVAVFANDENRAEWVFITPEEPRVENGTLCFVQGIRMAFDAKLAATVERVDVSCDQGLKNAWGDAVYRVKLSGACGKECRETFVFRQEEN